jgi:hypothetical protein
MSMEPVSKDLLDARLATVETRIEGRLVSLETRMESGFNELRAEFRAEMHKNTAELVKWIVGTSLAMSAVALTVMTFVLNNAVPKAPSYPPPQPAPAPIVIQMPAPPAPVPVPPSPVSPK